MTPVLKFACACAVVFGLLLGCQPARDSAEEFDRAERCLAQGGTVTLDKHGLFVGCINEAWVKRA